MTRLREIWDAINLVLQIIVGAIIGAVLLVGAFFGIIGLFLSFIGNLFIVDLLGLHKK